MTTSNILVVDDDVTLRDLLVQLMKDDGHRASGVGSVKAMRRALREEQFDLVLLDLMLPGEDGLSALNSATGTLPPIVMMSAYGTTDQKIVGLDAGAEDFIQKPCPPAEIAARVRRVLRRRGAPREPGAEAVAPRRSLFMFAGWTLDATTRTLFDPDQVIIDLSAREFDLLHALVRNPQRILSRDVLLEQAVGMEADVFDRAIDVQISRLRKKMADRAGSLELVRTHRGKGYELAVPVTH